MNGTYALTSNGTNAITERKLGFHTAGTVLTSSTSLTSNTLSGGTRTMVVTRSIAGMNSNYFTFPSSAQSISIIWARGNSSTFGQHSNSLRGSSILTLQDACNFPNTALQAVSVCSGDSAQIFGVWRTQAGVYSTTLTSSIGCDSIVEQELVIQNSITNTLTPITLCNGDSAMVFGSYVSAGGVYVDTVTSSGGCDSIIDITVSVESVTASVTQNGATLDATASNAAQYTWIDCSNNTALGVSTPVFTATANGTYAVVASRTNCSDTSACFTVSGIGLNEIDMESISAFPLPFRNEVKLQNLPEGGELRIISITGEIIFQRENVESSMTIQSEAWPSGLYIVTTQSLDGSLQTIKITKD